MKRLVAIVVIALPCLAQQWDCRAVQLQSGNVIGREPEDFELDPTPGASRLIVGSMPPFVVPITESGLGTPQPIAVHPADITLDMVGISAVLDAGGVPLLYAINKHRGIEVFEIERDRLVHRKSIGPTRPRDLANANEVLALPDGRIYVSRAQGRSGLAGLIELLFNRPWAKLMFFDGTSWREEAGDLRFGNGLQISSDGRTLYVAAFGGKEIRAYDRAADGTLGNPRRFRLPSHPDNLKWSGEHTLITAAHPSRIRTALHLRNIGSPPSEVYEIDVRDGRHERIYRNDGSPIAAASTVHREGGRMFLSQIIRPWLAECVR